jgi:hypothetical protein
MLSVGWYGKYVLPVDAASQIITLLVKSGATKVDTENVTGIPYGILMPKKMDFNMQPLEGPFIADCPTDEGKRKGYLDYLKTKAAVVEGYEPETYTQYLKAKDAS